MINEAVCSKSACPIGLFDSGLGGLTVVSSLKQRLPGENLIYFGDTARVPYGNKSRDTILRYSIENTIFLLNKNIKLLVVACNTASAYSIARLQQIFSIPILGVIEAGAECAVRTSKNQCIAILGTQGTIASGAYQQEIRRRHPDASLTTIPCPLFVPLVEERFVSHPAARLIVQEYLKPIRNTQVDTILLGCTHYPLLRDLIREEAGDGMQIVDSASTCAEMVDQKLAEMRLHNTSQGVGQCSYYVSDDPHKFRHLACDFLNETIEFVVSTNTIGF